MSTESDVRYDDNGNRKSENSKQKRIKYNRKLEASIPQAGTAFQREKSLKTPNTQHPQHMRDTQPPKSPVHHTAIREMDRQHCALQRTGTARLWRA